MHPWEVQIGSGSCGKEQEEMREHEWQAGQMVLMPADLTTLFEVVLQRPMLFVTPLVHKCTP